MKQGQLYAQYTKKRINKNENTAESAPSLPTPSIRGCGWTPSTLKVLFQSSKSLLN